MPLTPQQIATTTVEVPLSLLYRIDSITSLILHRERNGLSEQTVSDLDAVCREVRGLTKQAERDGQPMPSGTDVATVRMPTPEERERDRRVIRRAIEEFDALPEPAPDLASWLSGVCKALMMLREGDQ